MSGFIPLEVPVQLSREEAQRKAAEELAKAKYGVEMPDWLRRLWDALRQWLESLMPTEPPPQAGAPSGPQWILPVVVVLLIAAIGVIVWKVGLPRLNRRHRDADVEVDAEVSPDEYRTLADEAAARGDWETAVRERFRALVRELEIATVLDPRPSRTAMEVAWLTGRVVPTAAGEITQAANLFSEVAYGDRRPSAGDDTRMRTLVEQVLDRVRHTDLSADPEEEPAGVGISS